MAKKVKEAYEKDSNSNGENELENEESNTREVENEASGQTGGSRSVSQSGDQKPKDLSSLIAELDKATQERDEARNQANEMQARYLRAVADLENYRKRALKEREDLSVRVQSDFAEDLLPVLDNFRLGMKAANDHPEAKVVADGLSMVLGQFMEVLKSRGVEEMDPTGEEFDPQFHECVSHLPHEEVPENHVIETVRPGFRLKERLIRAANVVVSSGKGE